jgi:alpha-L-fucosidase 2
MSKGKVLHFWVKDAGLNLRGMVVLFIAIIFFSCLSATHSFDQTNGVLAVDYANYLSKHNIVFNRPITDSTSGLTIGNGRVGAMVWNSNGITMQVTGVDASEQTCFSEGWVNLTTSPKMDSNYTTFQQVLSLYDGLITTRYDTNRTVTIMGSPNSEVLGIHVDDSRAGVKSAVFQIKMWDPNTQITSSGTWNSMMSDVPDINTWKTMTSYADPAVAGINRGQTDANNFGYTLAATVDGATFATQVVDARTVRLTITPSSSYTIWIACASRMNAPGNDSKTQATTLLAAVKTAGYASTLAAFKNWWHAYWAKSFVQYSNAAGDADYLENMYYDCGYLVASGAFGNYPLQFTNGVYKHNADIGIIWSGGYWYWDNRNVYNFALGSNHPEVLDGFLRLFFRNLPTLKSFTLSHFSIDGAWTPETMGWDGNARWTTSSTYVDRIYSTSAEVATNMYMRFAYTGDTAFLKDTAYPFMKETAKFYSAKLSFDPALHQYYMANSNVHETYWGVKNAITDLAAVRSLFPQAIQCAKALNLDPTLQTQWQNIVDSLAPFKTESYNGGLRYLPNDPPAVASSNVENVQCEILWSYSVTGIGYPDYQIALNTFNSRLWPYQNPIMPCAVQAARLGLGDNTFNGIKTLLGMSQSKPSGVGGLGSSGGAQSFDFAGLHQLYINESLLQSYNDIIRVFPALPSDASFVSKFTLLAKGAFLVSSEKENGEIKYIGVKSLMGNTATCANPWGTQQVQVRKVPDNSIVVTTSDTVFTFPTTAAGIYVVERTAKNLSSYTFTQLTGTANWSAKTMGTMSLGMGQGKAPPVSALPSFPSMGAPAMSPRTMRVAGDRFVVRKSGAGNEYSLAVYGLSGKRIKEVVVNKDVIDMRKDIGVSSGVYIVRVSQGAEK